MSVRVSGLFVFPCWAWESHLKIIFSSKILFSLPKCFLWWFVCFFIKYFTCRIIFSGGDGGGEDEIMVVKVVVKKIVVVVRWGGWNN